ncbi:hypothetical protein GW17_00057503 [Ensete ventricosum]|nr:hypothetical protein GW17_00057503 [Ensete ventricosum]
MGWTENGKDTEETESLPSGSQWRTCQGSQQLGQMGDDPELGLGDRLLEWWSSGRLYDHWRPPYLHPAGCPCRVGHVGGPAVRGYDDVTARSAFVISFFPPGKTFSRRLIRPGNCDVARVDLTEQELGNCDVARVDPTEQELGNCDATRVYPTEQELGNCDVARVDPTEQELGNRDIARVDPTEQELGNCDVARVDPTEQELGNCDVRLLPRVSPGANPGIWPRG